MIREGDENTELFVGTEIENSPAMGKPTLFVVGLQPVYVIVMKLDEANAKRRDPIQHIYFGANQSFPQQYITEDEWKPWVDMVAECLANGYLCTLDVDVYQARFLPDTELTGYVNFIPMISVKLPHINQLGYNATLKIDDVDFAATNPGVWCHSVHDLQNRSVFTDWSKYSKDAEIE